MSIVRILLMSVRLLRLLTIFQKIKIFENSCSNLMKRLLLGVCYDKTNVIQVFESIYIDSNCLYSQKN